MAYCEENDLYLVVNVDRVTEAADDDASGTADTDVISTAIALAGGTIFGRIKRRYSSSGPDDFSAVTDVPDELRFMCARLAAANVFERQLRDAAGIKAEVMAWAQDVRDGVADLSDGTMTAVARSKVKGRARFYREKNKRHKDVGEPEEGDVDSDTDNSFMVD